MEEEEARGHRDMDHSSGLALGTVCRDPGRVSPAPLASCPALHQVADPIRPGGLQCGVGSPCQVTSRCPALSRARPGQKWVLELSCLLLVCSTQSGAGQPARVSGEFQ